MIEYQPIVKMKPNDLMSVTRLYPRTAARVRPLVEVLRPAPRESVEAHLASALKSFLRFYPLNRAAVDLSLLPPDAKIDGMLASKFGYEALAARGRRITPVETLHCDEAAWLELASTIKRHGCGLLVRLEVDDLEQPSETIAHLLSRLRMIAMDLKDCDIAVDLGSFESKPTEDLGPRLLDMVSHLVTHPFRSLALGGSSIPQFVSDVPEQESAAIRRKELDLWLRVCSQLRWARHIGFLDHGIVFPGHIDGVKNPNINGKLRYTSGAETLIFRGCSRARTPLSEQYPQIVRRVVDSKHYLGPEFSYGDKFLYQCAYAGRYCADMGKWVCADNNHHLTYVQRQIAEMHRLGRTRAHFTVDEVAL